MSQHPVYLATKERFDKARAQNAFKREDFTNIEVEKNIYLDARIMEWHCDTRITPEYQELINQKGALEELDLRLANFLEEMKTF